MTDVAAQILANLTALEDVARPATPGEWSGECVGSEGYRIYAPPSPTGRKSRRVTATVTYEDFDTCKADAAHMALNDPAHVLRLCTALRAVVELHGPNDSGWYCLTCGDIDEHPVDYPCPTLTALAAGWGVSGVDA
jgi:hypothetical protein